MAILASSPPVLAHREITLLEIIGMIDDAVVDAASISSRKLADIIVHTVEERMTEARNMSYGFTYESVCDEVCDFANHTREWDVSDSGTKILFDVEDGFRKVWTGAPAI